MGYMQASRKASAKEPTRSSKRKRAQVKYVESDTSDSEQDDYIVESDDEGITSYTKKKPKPTPVIEEKVFPFTSLPPELRNRIYEMTMVDPAGIEIVSTQKNHVRSIFRRSIARTEIGSGVPYTKFFSRAMVTKVPVQHVRISPTLLLLNKVIYAEAQPVLYGGNAFSMEDTMAMYHFLAAIGPKNCEAILELELCGLGETPTVRPMNHPAFTLLRQATNLRRLDLSLCLYYRYTGKDIGEMLFLEMEHWFTAVGNVKGAKDGALDIVHLDKLATYPANEGPPMTTEKRIKDVMEDLRRRLKREKTSPRRRQSYR